jgi:cell wall assembly regulator SMI1
LGFPLDPDLAAWWSRHDGATFDGGQVLPGYVPYGIDAMLASRRMWLEVANEAWGDWARIAGAAQPAGGMAWAFLRELVPIAFDGSGNDLVVDFRHGPLRGCIKAYAHEEGALTPPPWSGLGEMLSEVAAALRTGAPVGWVSPTVEEDKLVWRPVPPDAR